jgi:SNF family Na+-dependent transporter
MGYLSHVTGQDIDNIIQAGQGLAYVVYPYAVTTIAAAPVWSIMFFFMMILLGIDSTLGCIEVTFSSLSELLTSFKKTKLRKNILFALIFVFYFLGGLIFTLNSGTYWIEIFNTNACGWAILVVGFCECIAVSFFYGMENIRRDIGCMLGSSYTNWTFYIWYPIWGFITPIILLIIFCLSWSKTTNQKLGDYLFPDWTFAVGQIMTSSICLGIVLWPIYAIIDAKYFKKRV